MDSTGSCSVEKIEPLEENEDNMLEVGVLRNGRRFASVFQRIFDKYDREFSEDERGGEVINIHSDKQILEVFRSPPRGSPRHLWSSSDEESDIEDVTQPEIAALHSKVVQVKQELNWDEQEQAHLERKSQQAQNYSNYSSDESDDEIMRKELRKPPYKKRRSPTKSTPNKRTCRTAANVKSRSPYRAKLVCTPERRSRQNLDRVENLVSPSCNYETHFEEENSLLLCETMSEPEGYVCAGSKVRLAESLNKSMCELRSSHVTGNEPSSDTNSEPENEHGIVSSRLGCTDVSRVRSSELMSGYDTSFDPEPEEKESERNACSSAEPTRKGRFNRVRSTGFISGYDTNFDSEPEKKGNKLIACPSSAEPTVATRNKGRFNRVRSTGFMSRCDTNFELEPKEKESELDGCPTSAEPTVNTKEGRLGQSVVSRVRNTGFVSDYGTSLELEPEENPKMIVISTDTDTDHPSTHNHSSATMQSKTVENGDMVCHERPSESGETILDSSLCTSSSSGVYQQQEQDCGCAHGIEHHHPSCVLLPLQQVHCPTNHLLYLPQPPLPSPSVCVQCQPQCYSPVPYHCSCSGGSNYHGCPLVQNQTSHTLACHHQPPQFCNNLCQTQPCPPAVLPTPERWLLSNPDRNGALVEGDTVQRGKRRQSQIDLSEDQRSTKRYKVADC